MKTAVSRFALLLLILALLGWASAKGHKASPIDPPAPFGLTARVPWTTSQFTGSPDPPPPYRTERTFARLQFKNPTFMAFSPDGKRVFVGEQRARVYSFANDPSCEKSELAIDLRKEIKTLKQTQNAGSVAELYGMAFHPRFDENRYCYLCYTINPPYWGQLPDGTRVSRFKLTEADPPRIDPDSETVLISWLGGGHNGGCLEFGRDGCLYISTGDGGFPNPPDVHRTGQNINDLAASILRIDVDHESTDAEGKGRPYTIPRDNPFVGQAEARGEVWAFGFRNPWKMSFDRETGDLWTGDVGWELWELVQRVVRGGNYGWSINEGTQPVYPENKPGPSPLLPPTIALPHTESASITGGYVYRGKRYPDLVGSYVFGDWETRRIWGARAHKDSVEPYRELALAGPRVVAFGEDRQGELYILDYDQGTIHQLVPNPPQAATRRFPRRLSETGLLADVARHTPAPGVIPFSIPAEQWADHATSERLLALPDKTTVSIHPEPVEIPGSMFREQLAFPADGLLSKTISLEMVEGDPVSRRRLETQILHFDGRNWRGYSYEWNDDQTDAELIDARGHDRKITVVDAAAPGGRREQTWHFASRNECLICHNPWAGFRLAFTPEQLNSQRNYGRVSDNQLRTLEHIGAVTFAPPKPPAEGDPAAEPKKWREFVDPYDTTAEVNARARAWLHVNCAHCHQFGAGGTADIELRAEIPIEQTKTIEAQPKQGAFGIKDVQILAPGDPFRSVLFYRIFKMGRGRMPHLGSELVDERGVRLMHDWIRQLPIRKDEVAVIERLRSLDEETNLAREKRDGAKRLKQLTFEIAQATEREKPTPEDEEAARVRAAKEIVDGAKSRDQGRKDAINQLLAAPTTAVLLARTLDVNPLPPAIAAQVIETAQAHSDSQIRDLFERFLPPDQRVARLGNTIDPAQLLAVSGDADRGRGLYLNATGLQCKNCHRIGEVGSTLGPDLSHVGKKYNRAQLLESLLEPSKTVEPKYAAYVLETTGGQTYTGQMVEQTPTEVVLKDAAGKEIRVHTDEVEKLIRQNRSLMPDQLFRDMTQQQAADLLAYLESLK